MAHTPTKNIKIMFKTIFFLFFFLTSITAKAHQPDVSTTMLVEKENNVWILQISASLTAFQQEIRTHYSETPYKTPDEFRQMVLEHIKKNLTIRFNKEQEITLSAGIVKLGHETKVVFEVFGVPTNINSVYVKNTAFKEIYKNQSALVLLKDGFNKEHFVLNKSNEHSLSLEVGKNEFVEIVGNKTTFSFSRILLAVMGILIVMSCGILILKKINKHLFSKI